MDTTQKTRGDAPARRPRTEGGEKKQNPRPPRQASVPQSAQQRNGAVRTAEGQRTGAKPQRPSQPHEEKRQSVKTAPRRKEAQKPARPPRKRSRQEEDDTLSSKRRSYGKTKPKKKSALASMGDFVKQTAQRSAAKAKAKKETAAKGRHPQQPTPAVIYTEPKTFNRSRFTVQLLTVTAIVMAMVLGLSVFFKVKTITVSGAEVYSAWAVREASGIQEGDNLLSFGNVRAGALIKANLPYVDKVRLGIKLPDTVNIIIEEEDVVYAIQSQDGLWWLITSEGRVVEQSTGGKAPSYTQILGVTLTDPIPNEKAVATEFVPLETAEGEETRPVVVTGAQKLDAALKILKALEANDIVGAAGSVDVTKLDSIVLWYGTRYEVSLGDTTNLDYKIACMNDVILQLSDYQTGYLDLSFTIWPDKAVYTPF